MQKLWGIAVAVTALVLMGCGAPDPAARENAATVIVPQTVVVRETVIVPQTVVVKQTVMVTAPMVVPSVTVEPLALSGKGQQATEMFTLPAGLVVFEMQHDGESNFIVHLIDDQGKRVEYMVSEIGQFNGSKAVRVPSAGRYLLDIAADGNWSIKTR